MRFARVIPTLLFAACIAGPAVAQDAPLKDHPRFSGMPSYQIDSADVQEFGAAEFEIGTPDPKHVEGKYWKIDYVLKEGQRKAGPLQIGRASCRERVLFAV